MQEQGKKKDNSKGKSALAAHGQTKIYQAVVIASSEEDDFNSFDSGTPVVSDHHRSVFKK